VKCPIALLAVAAIACGGETTQQDGGPDAQAVDASEWDGSVTPCSAGEAMLCGGNCGDTCPRTPEGTGCQELADDDGGHLAICDTIDGGIEWALKIGCAECSDGHVCVATTSELYPLETSADFGSMVCTDVRFAEMYALNGHADLARYPDRSAYTADPLPTPGDCPSVSGITLCGGACGECPSGYVCVGRSPLHPYSLCVNDWRSHNPPGVAPAQCIRSDDAGATCYDGNDTFRCLTFKVDDASQPVADQYSLCVDKALCFAAAAGYPGGAFCTGTAFP